MRTALCVLILVAASTLASADTNVTEDITVDTTWDLAGSPYIINQDISVLSGSTLTIDPGVTVKVDSLSRLRTDSGGSIVAVGSQGSEILFTSGKDSPAPNDWWGVCPWQPSSSVFSYCILEYGRYNLYSDHSSPTISSCISRYGYLAAFFCEDASPTITGCTATDSQFGIRISNGSPTITSCSITNTETGLYIDGPDANPVIHDCNIYGNTSENMYVRDYTELPATVIEAEGNWWGVDTDPEIAGTIYIGSSYEPYVEVDYDPWLHEVPVDESTWGRVKHLYR
jgi:parallel beta-helix repeat protein